MEGTALAICSLYWWPFFSPACLVTKNSDLKGNEKGRQCYTGKNSERKKKGIKYGQHINIVACTPAIIALLNNAYSTLSLEFLNAHLSQFLKDVISEYGLGSHCI